MRKAVWFGALVAVLLSARGVAEATIDLVTLPDRDRVQLTIYNSADITLVREVRNLTLKKGINRLSFGWANTLIDPTSLDLRAIERPDAVTLLDITYPPGVNTTGIWTVQSDIEGEVPVEITFFTSGISWRAFYMATLAADEKSMRLAGYVRVMNNSGEDYANAQTRLIVGKIHLLDEIAALARRPAPYGRPGEGPPGEGLKAARAMRDALAWEQGGVGPALPKEIVKEGLSEYFLYTIEGTETIPTGWAKRLPSFAAEPVLVENLYKYEERRYGPEVVRFLYFKNDEAHKLGQTPIPDGLVKVFRSVDDAGHLSYEGANNIKYIPVDQEAELNLGPTTRVSVEPTLMAIEEENHVIHDRRGIIGYDWIETWKVEVKNYREVAVRVEVTRDLQHQYWKLDKRGDFGDYVRDDLDTVRFTLTLEPHTEKTFGYTVRHYEGVRREGR